MTEVEETVESPAPAAKTTPKRAGSDVGDRIAAILDAAEASAERIRAEARDEAAQILQHAHLEGATRAEELSREPQRLRDEAAREAAVTREDAAREAAATREAAEHDAATMREAAAADVAQAEATVAQLSLQRDSAAADVRAAAEGLRATADRMEDGVLQHVAAVERLSTWRRLFSRKAPPMMPAALPPPAQLTSGERHVESVNSDHIEDA